MRTVCHTDNHIRPVQIFISPVVMHPLHPLMREDFLQCLLMLPARSDDLHLCICIEQIPHHNASHLPGSSDDEDIFSFTKFQRRCTCKCSDRYRKVRHLRGFYNLLGKPQCPLKYHIHFRIGLPALFRRKIRLLDLSYNFNLSKHSRIQSANYAAQMCQAAFSFIPHSGTLQCLNRKFLRVRKLLFQPYKIRVCAAHIDLASITCHK